MAKAFPSTLHAAILQALSCIGAPIHLLNLVECIYGQPMNECKGLAYRIHRGIKEGCPLSPALFTLVYESFHGTLQREFSNVEFYIYVDNIAFIACSESDLHAVLRQVHKLSQLLGFLASRSTIRKRKSITMGSPHHYHFPCHVSNTWGTSLDTPP